MAVVNFTGNGATAVTSSFSILEQTYPSAGGGTLGPYWTQITGQTGFSGPNSYFAAVQLTPRTIDSYLATSVTLTNVNGFVVVLTVAGALFDLVIPGGATVGSPSIDLSPRISGLLAGDDQITITGSISEAWGDHRAAPAGTVTYGGDVINLRGGVVEVGDDIIVYGDARSIAATAPAVAGDDIISTLGADFGATYVLYGDFRFATGPVTFGNDIIYGGASADTLYGDSADLSSSGGNDVLYGREGADNLYGAGGNDTLLGGAGADNLYGGAGVDIADYSDNVFLSGTVIAVIDLLTPTNNTFFAEGDFYVGIENVRGSNIVDDIRGDDLSNALVGRGGDDTLNGRGGNDVLFGGAGGDTLIGGAGVDYADYIESTVGIVVDLATPSGSTGMAAGDTFSGVEGLRGTGAIDDLRGDALNNLLFGRSGSDTLIGRAGNDILTGGAGADTHLGGAGSDFADYLDATAGVVADLLTPAANTGFAAGDSYVEVENLRGSIRADSLRGNDLANQIFGNAGNDVIIARGGNDFIIGQAGADTINGGAGIDRFAYYAASEGGDIIQSFEAADVFVFEGSAFGFGTFAGTLAANRFQSGATNVAADAFDRFLFRTTDGTLWFDADGSGAAGPVLIADLTNAFAVTAADILII